MPEPEEKDNWDKFKIWCGFGTAVGTSLIGIVGIIFTTKYNEANRTLREVEIVEAYIPHLEKGGRSREAALIGIESIGARDTAIRLIELYADVPSANVLSRLIHTSSNQAGRDQLTKTFRTITGNKVRVVTMVPEVRQRVDEPYTVMVPKTTTRVVTVLDPKTGKPKLDPDTKEPMQLEIPFVESVAEQRTRTVSYTEEVPKTLSFDAENAIRTVLSSGPLTMQQVRSKATEQLDASPNVAQSEGFNDQLESWIRILTHPIESGADSGKVRLSP